jgi:uncharacterized protein YbjT (DUF2867 family)
MILVIGGTGTVGSQVVRELLSRGQRLKVLTRNAGKPQAVPESVERVVGNLLDPEALRSVFNGVDAVYMANTSSPSEAYEGLNAVARARSAGVKRFVYQSVFGADEVDVPIIASKTIIEASLKASGMAYVILRPNNFFQNDHWFRDAVLQYGVYPQPLGKVGVSRVDVRDIAEAAAVALTTDTHDGATYNLVGPQSLTVGDVAAVWSEVLGKPVSSGSDDLNEWEAAARQTMPAQSVYDLRLLFDLFHTRGFKASHLDLERQRRLLAHEPRQFKTFAQEAAIAWGI